MKINDKKKKQVLFLILFIFSLSYVVFQKRVNKTDLSKKEKQSYNVINIFQAKERFDDGSFVFLDARVEIFFNLGHIKNSINIPPSKFNQLISNFERKFPRSTRIIIYCSGSQCSSSFKLAQLFMKRGYLELEVFFSGWKEWVESSYPIEKSFE